MDHAMDSSITFRRMEINRDVRRLFEWLADDDVRRWYDEGEHSVENYRRTFAPEPTVNKFIVEIEGNPVGYLQTYWLSDEPDYAAQLGLDHDAVSIDMFIGDADWRGHGWGSRILTAALERMVFGEMQAEWACINPDPENTRAVRSYEKAGFRGERVVRIIDDEPGNTGNERIMLQSREDFCSRVADANE